LDVTPADQPPMTQRARQVVEQFEVKPAAVSVQAPVSSRTPESEIVITWRKIVDLVRLASPQVAAMLDLAVPTMVTKEKVVIGIEDESFEQFRSEQTNARAILTSETRAFFASTTTEIVFEHAAKGSKVGGSISYLDAAKKKQAQIDARLAVENHELVQRAVMLFDAELKDVKLPAMDD